MKLTRLVKAQLAMFSLLTVVGLVVMATSFVRVPSMLNIGTIRVTAEMPNTGGLYVNGNVTYRGDTVGKVTDVSLSPAGVRATMTIDSDVEVPVDLTAYVKSMSAVGEQFVDLVPNSSGGPYLADGDVVSISKDAQPVPIGPLLDRANQLLATVPEGKLKTLVDEAFSAFNGYTDDLRTLIDSTKEFLEAANANVDQTETLLRQAGPLLDTQIVTSDQIRSWTEDLATVTDTLRQSDPSVRRILVVGPESAATTTSLFQSLQPTLPLLLANLVSTSKILLTYNPGLEQLLVLLPPLQAAQLTVVNGGRADGAAKVDFYLNANAPQACTTGYLPSDQRRSPTDLTVPSTPSDLYCMIPQNADEIARGARNLPCMEVPGKRAPTPEICRSPEPYAPIGTNPLFGNANPGAAPGDPSYSTGGVAFAPPTDDSAATSTAVATYDPVTGVYASADGRRYRTDVGNGSEPSSLQSLMTVAGETVS